MENERTVKKFKRPTLRDIAERVGVSVPTVSEILSNTSRNYCSQSLRDRVREVAKELNYRPNIGYKIMHSQQTRIVSIICSSGHLQQEEHILELIMNLTRLLEAKQYTTYVASMTRNADANVEHIETLCLCGSCSFIFIGPAAGRDRIYLMLAERRLNYIGYNAESPKNIRHDRNQALAELVRHLCSQGCRSIATLSFEASMAIPAGAFGEAVRRDTLIPSERWNGSDDFRDFCFTAGKEWMKGELDARRFSDGITFYNDYFALGGVFELNRRGIIPGRDVQVAGLNNTFAVRASPFPISSARLDISRVGELLVGHLFDPSDLDMLIDMNIYRR